MASAHYFMALFLISFNVNHFVVNGNEAYHNPLLSYTTRSHPGHPLVYQPFSTFPYQAACSEGVFAPIASDCTKYNRCINFKLVQFSCSDGLHWNSAINVCDWPANANCNASPAPLGPGGIQQSGLSPLGPGGIQQTPSPLGPGGIQQSGNQVDSSGSNSDDDDITVLIPSTETVVAVVESEPAPNPHPPTDFAPVISPDTGMKVVCYFTNWAWYRPEPGKYDPSDIDTELCTHVNFGFVVLHPTNLVVKIHDPWSDIDNEFFTKVSGLKNKGIKALVALGGWNDSEGNKYSRMVATQASRKKFIDSAVEFIERYGFEGLDLDWEYPVCWQVDCDAGPSADKENFALLVKELSDVFRPKGLLLTAAVSPSKKVIDAGYDVPELNKYLDIINVMTYDYYGHWDKKTGHVAPLYHHPDASNPTFSANYTMNYWHSKGADKKKLVMGMPTYGQTFTLGNPSENELGAPAPQGGGNKGRFTRQKGFASYYEICGYINQEGYKLVYDNEKRMGPYAHKGNQWVGFDDVETIKQKSQYVLDNGFGGGMIWALDLDDFNNICGCEKYPLLKTINRVLRNYNSPDPHCTLDSNTIPRYQTRQHDLALHGGHMINFPASTYPMSPMWYLQRGQNTVPYLIPSVSHNVNNLKKWLPNPTRYQGQHITSYPAVNHVSPWGKILYSG